MYPQNPTPQAWRAAAATAARTAGAEVPHWFTGTDADVARLNGDFPDLLAAVRWYQQDYVRTHPDDFPEALRAAAADFLAKNAAPAGYAAPYALESYGIGAMAADFAKAAGTAAVEYTQDGILSAKSALGLKADLPPAPKPAGGLSTLALVLIGATVGAAAWVAFGRKGGA